MRYLKIYVIIPIFTLILVFCLPPKNANSDNSNETVIADVDGNPITLAELRLAINSLPIDYQQMAKTSMSQMMLQQLIDLKLFSVKADVENITNKISYRTELKFLVDQLKREHYLRLLYAQKITKDLFYYVKIVTIFLQNIKLIRIIYIKKTILLFHMVAILN